MASKIMMPVRHTRFLTARKRALRFIRNAQRNGGKSRCDRESPDWFFCFDLPMRHILLRVNALFLVVAAAGGFATDLAGAFLQHGPQGIVLAAAPYAAIGFVEAHGLAFIIGVLLWRAEPERNWHLTAAAVHVLLGSANLVFWQIFLVADMLAMGYVTTSLHVAFAGLQSLAAFKSGALLARAR
jgi:hypothetical protein